MTKFKETEIPCFARDRAETAADIRRRLHTGKVRNEKAGLRRPEFRNEEYGFFVTVYRETPQKTPQKKYLDDRLWEAIKGNPKITRARLADELGLSEYTVKEYIAKLKKQGRLERKGSDRAGFWVVREKKKK